MYRQLKFVKLSYSQHLIETPDFSGAPNLRRLILEGCKSLSKVHPSIGDLNKLVFLNLEGCENLKSFLRSICMEHLSELSLEGTAVKGLPLSIEYLTGPVLLNLRNCQNPESLPSCIYRLRSLEILILSDCLKLKRASRTLGKYREFVGTFLRWNCSKRATFTNPTSKWTCSVESKRMQKPCNSST